MASRLGADHGLSGVQRAERVEDHGDVDHLLEEGADSPGQARFAAEDPNRFTLMGFIAASARR